MAVDPQAPPTPEPSVAYSPIENEIPTYRAISALAVTSLILGLISVGTFASKVFLIASAAAVVVGLIAERRIRRAPDALTGRGFAQVGIALGLVFGLSSLTFGFMRDMKVRGEAVSFAERYGEILQSKSLPDAFWYRSRPSMRPGKTPAKLLAEFKEAAAGAGDPMMEQQQLGPVEHLITDLESPGSSVRFLELEDYGFNELTPFAFVVYEIQPGEHAEHAEAADHEHHHEGPTYALLQIESDPQNPTFDWHIEEFVYPYNRRSHQLATKPIDDGHGH